MAYDAADGYVVLFGGCSVWSCSGSPMGDTWIFASDQWTDVTGSQVTSPPPRSIAQMTYDPIDREVVLFGGLGPTQSYALNDTWAFSGGQWTNLTANLTTSPPARYRGTMAYDGHDHYVLLYGGTHDTSTASPYNDTWTFVNQTWTNITKKVTSNLPGRLRAGMTYDAADGYILMFGGCTSASCPTADTWKYVNHTWTSLTGSLTTAPSARVYSQLTYDARDGYAVLFGGGQSTAGPGDRDTWAFTGGAWKNISGGLSGMPPARGFDELAYDGAANLTLMFSGYYDSTTALLNDTWSFGPEIVGTASTNPPQMDLGQSATFTVGAVSNFEPLTYT
ncbi:MAG TPA: kelch repeat-containing protein, partial [Thermoplasmata archaeon]|nr:kelch repeat-containing protein [Thermoplasmata archaeon]